MSGLSWKPLESAEMEIWIPVQRGTEDRKHSKVLHMHFDSEQLLLYTTIVSIESQNLSMASPIEQLWLFSSPGVLGLSPPGPSLARGTRLLARHN